VGRLILVVGLIAAHPGLSTADTPGRLEVSPLRLTPGGTVTAIWNGTAAPTSAVWVGLYRPGAGRTAYLDRLSTLGPTRGSVAFELPARLALGTYELRLYADADHSLLAISNRFTVEASVPRLVASPVRCPLAGMISATWTGIPTPNVADWIGLYAPGADDSDPLDGRSTTGQVLGTVPLVLPHWLPPGTYELRLFGNQRQTLLAVSNRFSLEYGVPSLTVNPVLLPPGGTLDAVWSGTTAPTSQVWVGLYRPGAGRTAYLDRLSAIGPAGGSARLALSSRLAPGIYELRLYARSDNSLLAVSNRFTVDVLAPR
jgi:hypothetical protein